MQSKFHQHKYYQFLQLRFDPVEQLLIRSFVYVMHDINKWVLNVHQRHLSQYFESMDTDGYPYVSHINTFCRICEYHDSAIVCHPVNQTAHAHAYHKAHHFFEYKTSLPCAYGQSTSWNLNQIINTYHNVHNAESFCL